MLVIALSGNPKSCANFEPVDNERCVLRALIATNQEAVTPILSHRRKVERLQKGGAAVLAYTLLPESNCALDVAPLVRPLAVNSSRHQRGLSSLFFFQHRHAPRRGYLSGAITRASS